MTSGLLTLQRGPVDDDELWEFIHTLWGLTIPRKAFCPKHVAPFDAVADAFFSRYPVTVWKASRGFGGKSTILGALSLTEAMMGAEVSVLGGSAAQSIRVNEVIQNECLAHSQAPKGVLSKATKFETHLTSGGWVRALMASQRSVRGPHPQRLRMDEIDEMELEILEAAQGQPMMRHGIQTQTVMSSTHQYPDKTMNVILHRAKEKGWPVYEWCYKENLVSNGGWLPDEEIARKRNEISKQMWEVEYDLQEPSFQGRAIDPIAVDVMWNIGLGEYEGNPNEYIELSPNNITPEMIEYAGWDFREPAIYITSVDWAKERDWTVIKTWAIPKNEDYPYVLVAFERFNRMPWPAMAQRFDARLIRFKGLGVHDATGIGSVVEDLLEHEVQGVQLMGRTRDALWSEYVSAIENGKLIAPRITWAWEEHKFTSVDDLYGTGHTPDSFVSGALAWGMRKEVWRATVAPIIQFTRDQSPWDDHSINDI